MLLTLLITLAATMTTTANASANQTAAKPTTRPAATTDWAKHYYDRVALFKKENAAARNIVLVGSSHIERFNAEKLLPSRRVLNRGVASDRIGIDERGILHRLDSSVFDCNPGIIILENGVNDLGELWRNGTPKMDEIDKTYREVVQRIRTRLPDTPLIIVGLFPTRDRYAGLKPLIIEFNNRLKTIASDYDCPFMEVFSPLADVDGLLRAEYSRDGLHLSEAGYRVWADLIEKELTRQEQRPASRPSGEGEGQGIRDKG